VRRTLSCEILLGLKSLLSCSLLVPYLFLRSFKMTDGSLFTFCSLCFMTMRERTPEKSAGHVLQVSANEPRRPRLRRDGTRQRRFLVSTAVFGMALTAFSLSYQSTITSHDTLPQHDLGNLIPKNSSDSLISSSIDFEQQMAGINRVNIEEVSSPHQVDCAGISLDPNDDGQMRKTSIDPSFMINIHDPRTDIAVSQEIIDWGCFECDVMKATVKAIKDYPKANLLDIGANIGQYSLQAAAMGRQAYAFEPFKGNWRRFCHSIKANDGFHDRIKLFNAAVMHEPTNVKLIVGSRNQGGTKVVSYGRDETGRDMRGIAHANGVTLDDMSEYLPKGQVVLKIDVEGAECKALAGGIDKYLKQLDIVHVAIEWSNERLVNCERREEIFALLEKNGLKPYLHVENDVWEQKDPKLALQTWRHPSKPITALFDMAWARSNPGGAA